MMQTRIFILTISLLAVLTAQHNRLFWDGNDWNRIAKNVDYHPETTHRVKTAYLHGVLDGRLHGYLKTWAKDQFLADDVFGETVDYLSTRELIKNLDNFYEDPINGYIPIPAAIVIANMYAERIPLKIIDAYVQQTKFWINDLLLRLDEHSPAELLEEKHEKHREKQPQN